MQEYSCATLVLVSTLLTNWVLKLYPQLWGLVYYGVRVKVQVRAVHLATGDPERATGLLGSEAVFSAMGSGLLWGQGQGAGQSRAPCSG